MSEIATKLTESWQNIFNGSQKAIDWVSDVRPNVARLNNEADSLILELRRLRNTAKRLGAVSSRPMTAGFFGLSQAGKSYLISALAAGENGKLETTFDGKQLDFIEHINPPGGGKEATGLVTRFSRTAKGGINGFPLELRLFSEIEIAKILLNSYFNDFDKEKIDYQCEPQKINELIKRATQQAKAAYVDGITADDVVDLQDYATDSFGKSLAALQGNYWAKATALAPRLDIQDRAALFSILWGEVSELTSTYIQFANALARLGHPEKVYAPLSAVVKEVDGALSQADSIMNVDMLDRLGSAKDENIQVRPSLNDGTLNDAVGISLAQLTALTAELVFPLINKTRSPTFENVDLLDFPGYRGRLSIKSLPEVSEKELIPQIILRGKVAYLFERYTDSQEMNILIMCTPSNAQSEVNEVGPVLERWIKKTQGDTAEQRSARKPGLLWAITKFDIRIQSDLAKAEGMLKQSWGAGGLLQQTILERFGNYDWISDWSNGKPFDNLFLVRKPGFPVPFLEIENGKEIAEREQGQLALMRRTFAADHDVKTYVADPEQKWDAMMLLNDGGMKRISDYLQTIALPEVKQQRIKEQLNEAVNHIVENRFSSWYQRDGAEEVSKKRQLANAVANELGKKAMLVGEFLRCLQLPEDTIRSLYFSDMDETALDSNKNQEQAVANDFGGGFGFDDGFDLFAEPQDAPISAEKTVVEPIVESRFAQAVFKAWIEHLRGISNNDHLMNFFGFSKQNTEALVGELVTGANRLKLQEKLSKIAFKNENTGSKRDQLVERQVFSMNMLIADFIAWLDFISQPLNQRPASRAVNGAAVFEFKEVEKINNLPKLNERTNNFMKNYLFDWFVAFGQFAESNAGHSAGREIDASQNAKLGDVLTVFSTSAIN